MPDQVKNKPIVLIAGPTASGKSGAAIDLALSIGGEIINADAMQVYQDLKVITARPPDEDLMRVPHHLYGTVDGATAFSAGLWAQRAAEMIAEVRGRGRQPIFVGGSGLYFRALTDGFSPIPDVPAAFRQKAIDRYKAVGPEAFRAEVIQNDPAMARIPHSDTQRLMRAWEVHAATGSALSAFQALPPQKVVDDHFFGVVLSPEREALYARCDARAGKMLDDGAIEEVEQLMARNLDMSAPVMKALGVREIGAFLSGSIDRDEALTRLQQNTRRFAKRQLTWFRNQVRHWAVVSDGPALLRTVLTEFEDNRP